MNELNNMSIREQTEQNELNLLCSDACFSVNSKGRAKFEEKCSIRTDFQRDRDRIIHCSAFRRLKHKTQVFLSPEGDHYRTRLTHTLEVSQIARTISRALRLNEDLTEAIALGHDLGHTPFGHEGERALNSVLSGGFRHYEQSLRVVDLLEKNGCGLNLTYEVRNGILCHTDMKAETAEGRVVRFADRIAYMNHDIDDSIKGGIICEEDLPSRVRNVFGKSKSMRINSMVMAIVEHGAADIGMADEFMDVFNELHEFMFKSVYTNPIAKGEEHKANSLIKSLFQYYYNHPEAMSQQYIDVFEKEGADRAAADYVASMSDKYAMLKYEELFIPKSWMVL